MYMEASILQIDNFADNFRRLRDLEAPLQGCGAVL